MVPSVDFSDDLRSVTSYVPIVDPSRSLSEQHVGDLQYEMRITL